MTTLKTSPAQNSAKIASQIAGSKYASPESVKTSMGMKAADTSKIDMSPEKATGTSGLSTMSTIPGSTAPRRAQSDTGGFMPGKVDPTNAIKSEPEFKGRMVPPSESGIGATPPSPTFVGSKRDMRLGGPMGQMTSKDFAKNPPSSMNEEVTVGTNKYRIV